MSEQFKFIVKIEVWEEHEFTVEGKDIDKARKGLLKYLKDRTQIDPWKALRSGINSVNIVKEIAL